MWQIIAEAVQGVMSQEPGAPAIYGDCDKLRCSLLYRPPIKNRLADIAQEQDLRITCFGTDLVTKPSTSGSPVFLLTEGRQVVVGIHTGRIGVDSNRRPIRPGLENFERTVPLHKVWNAGLREFLEL